MIQYSRQGLYVERKKNTKRSIEKNVRKFDFMNIGLIVLLIIVVVFYFLK